MCHIQTRAILWVLILTACSMSYMLRVNMSINLIAMVDPSTPSESSLFDVSSPEEIYQKNNTTGKNVTINRNFNSTQFHYQEQSECLIMNRPANNGTEMHEMLTALPNYGTRYDWNSKIQGLILGSFFWGYIVSSMPGGLLAESIGPTRIVGWSILLSGFLTILTPLAASWHYGYVIAIRILLGLLGGVVYPALHSLIARWAPPVEKGLFIGALMGGTLGTVITWPLLGALLEYLGWVWAFFIPGGIAIFWCILWSYCVYDSPDIHPRMNAYEKIYIAKSLVDAGVTSSKGIPPYRKIFTSIPFWALTILHFGNLWGLYLLLTAGPKFMSEVLGFNLGHSGMLAALPYLARMIFGFVFGIVGDYIRKTGKMTVTGIRKSFIVFSHLIPGVLLVAQTFIGCDQTLAVMLLTFALGMNGASTVTNLQNAQDLSTNYAGSLYGIVNCIGGTTGFITPLLTGIITEERNGLFEWHLIFWIGASVYIVCGLIFCVFGSGEQQSWNNSEASASTTTKTTATVVAVAAPSIATAPTTTTITTTNSPIAINIAGKDFSTISQQGVENAAYTEDHGEDESHIKM